MKKIEAWQTDDDRVFATEIEAIEHEFRAYAVELFGVSATEMILSSSVTGELIAKLGDVIAARSRAQVAIRSRAYTMGETLAARIQEGDRRPVVSGSFGDFPPPAPIEPAFDDQAAATRIVATTFGPSTRPLGVGRFFVSSDLTKDSEVMNAIRAVIRLIGDGKYDAINDRFEFMGRSEMFRHVVLKGNDPIPLYTITFHASSDGSPYVQALEEAA